MMSGLPWLSRDTPRTPAHHFTQAHDGKDKWYCYMCILIVLCCVVTDVWTGYGEICDAIKQNESELEKNENLVYKFIGCFILE